MVRKPRWRTRDIRSRIYPRYGYPWCNRPSTQALLYLVSSKYLFLSSSRAHSSEITFYHQCNKSLVSLLLWFSFIVCPWCPSYKYLYVKASLLKKLTGIHANNCYNFIYLFWTLTHPCNILSSGWTRNYSCMSLSVGRSRDDCYRINDDRILPLRSSLTMLVMRSWMIPGGGLPIWKVWGCSSSRLGV